MAQSISLTHRPADKVGRTFRAVWEVAFELGLSGPGSLWYRKSDALSSREKLVLDAQMMGY